jgi:isoquinoline 1-oxidoreductase alpha subunit
MPTLNVNGEPRESSAEADAPLLWVLRSEFGLGGPKYGCGIGLCGACTVLLDGQPVRACLVTLDAIGKRAITTIEGFERLEGSQAQALKAAWLKLEVSQCGYCQPGQLLGAWALLRAFPAPDDSQIDAAMNGHLCRCGTYPRIRAAIHLAAEGKPLSGPRSR